MSREDEIRQGLREESGCLTFPLNALEYGQGFADIAEGLPPPKVSSPSYDLGRWRALEKREAAQDLADNMRREDEARNGRMREILKDHPEVLAEYLAKIAEICARAAQVDQSPSGSRPERA